MNAPVRRRAVAAIALAAASTAMLYGSAPALAASTTASGAVTAAVGPTVTRLDGADRYDVSANLSATTFSPGVPVAYVATGEKFPDALSGGPAGGVNGGPVLLVHSTSVPDSVASELARLKPRRIVVLGGTVSVSGSVETALAAYTSGSVTRLDGADRYDVSAAISASTFAPGVPVAYVATGEKFPDALSGGPAGGAHGGPVLLVRPTSVPDSVATELARLKPQRIVVLGGTVSVSGSVQTALGAYTTGAVTRLDGADRYDVSANLSATTFSPGVPVAYVATGEKFPDALSGGPAGGAHGGPVLLVRPTSVPDSVATELARLKPQRIVVLGGTVSVSGSVAARLASPTASADLPATGVPAGTRLKASGGLTISTAGTVVNGLDIAGCVDVRASNVVIKNTRIRCARTTTAVRVYDGVRNLVVVDSEIDGGGVVSAAVGFNDFTLQRVNIHNVVDGPRLGDRTRLLNSYVHDLVRTASSHNDAVQITGGTDIQIIGNTLDAYNAKSGDLMNAAIMIGSEFAPLRDLTITNNYLNGGNYTVNFRADTNAARVAASGNVFGPDHRYGEITRADIPGVQWRG